VNHLPKAMFLALPANRRLGAEPDCGMWSGVWGCVETGLGRATTQRNTLLVLLASLMLALPCAAQMELGNTAMSLSGDIGFNYNGGLDQGSSGHSLGFSGDAALHGSYYNPNFLSFDVRPFYDRTQSNSTFGALTNASGVNAGVNLFSGSHFPGSFSYSKVVNSSGEFGVPGSGIGLATNGNNQGFGVSWSALLPDWPTLTAAFERSSGSSSILGSQDESSQTDHDFTLQSTYHVAGFRLMAGYDHRNVDTTISQLVEGVPEPVNTDTATHNYQFNAQHSFPLQGSFSFSASRTGYDYNYHDSTNATSSGASDSLNGSLSIRPMTKLSVNFNANYSDSLLGSLPVQVVDSGGGSSLGKFRSFLVGSDANYQLLNNLGLHAGVNRIQQEFLGQSFSSTQFAAGANYNLQHSLLHGLSFSVGVVDSANKEGNTGVGAVGNLNYTRRLAGWNVDANFSYSQNVQTLVLVYTTSSMGYVTNVRHRVGNRSYFTAGFGGSHSGISAVTGSSSGAERVSSTFTYSKYSVNGFYSTSRGTAVFTTTGLVGLPGNLPPETLSPDALTVFTSKAYGFGLGGTFMRRLTFSAGYAQSTGNTIDPLASTSLRNNLINATAQYRLRKIYVNGGYTHLRQSLGAPGTAPITVTSYFIGISRWFNFF
jgi:hypothetical protein